MSYLPQSDQPQLQYLRPRLDFSHMDIDVKYIEQRKELQTEQIKAVLAYASKKECRSVQLLTYFDEPGSEKCGICDVCLAEKKASDADQLEDKIDFEIITLLQTETYALDELVNAIATGADNERLERIRTLLDAGKIKTDGKNYYL
ncbi:ATP-dependent DNA helicase RecQ [compost metagenome]